MRILKFGGTSVGSAESIKQVVHIIENTSGRKIVVLSAFSGITNLLVEIVSKIKSTEHYESTLDKINQRCLEIIDDLFSSDSYKQKATSFLEQTLSEIEGKISDSNFLNVENFLLAQGELLSTNIIQLYLEEQNISSHLIPALDFMRINENEEPDYPQIDHLLNSILESKNSDLYLTQGFICRNSKDQISNLQRGGSDYTASIIGAVTNATEIQIWTDIDGMHNNDPRFVENTFSVEEISFDEAAELAYFGAKILHPQSLIPAKNNNIPVLLKNTFSPHQKGTIIKKHAVANGVRSIAAKDNITAIKIKSYRMLMAYGFLKKVFDVFEDYKTPIDMITTSEVAVSLTIDDQSELDNIVGDLEPFGLVEVDQELSIICIAGDFSQNKEGISAKVFHSLKGIPIRMISYGGSNYNISLLVKTSDKKASLNALNQELFLKEEASLI